jgi:hypothetical protein
VPHRKSAAERGVHDKDAPVKLVLNSGSVDAGKRLRSGSAREGAEEGEEDEGENEEPAAKRRRSARHSGGA